MDDDFDPTDGCFLIIAPRDAARQLETDMTGDEPVAGAAFVREIHPQDLAALQCLLRGSDPNAPSEPRRTRYNPFTRRQEVLPRWAIVHDTWQCVIGGAWRTIAEVAELAAGGGLQEYSALVALLPDDLVRALATNRSPDLARRWRATMPEGMEPDVEGVLAAIVTAARRATELGQCVFAVELV